MSRLNEKKNHKQRWMAFVLVFVMVCMTIFSNGQMYGVKAQDKQSDIVFEDLSYDSVEVAGKASKSLRKLTTKAHGFRFCLQDIQTDPMKIGLYGSSENNVWSGGYILILNKLDDGTLNWAVRTGSGEKLVVFGELSMDLTKSFTVSVWLSEETDSELLNICVNDTQIVTDKCYTGTEVSVECDTYMSAYNDSTETQTITSVVGSDQEPDEGISFEDLAVTKGQNSMTLASKGNDFGAVSSMDKGFRYKITKPTGGQIKIGMYNKEANNVWSGGYLLLLQKGTAEGSVAWQLLDPSNNEAVITYGEYTTTSDEIYVNAWLDADKGFHLILDGRYVAADVKVATVSDSNLHMGAYNECSNRMTVWTIIKGYHEFTIRGINVQSGFDAESKAWKLYLNTDVNIAGTENTEYPATIYLDDSAQTTKLIKVGGESGNLLCLTIPEDQIPQNPIRDYKISLPKQTMESGIYSQELTKEYVFYVRKDSRVLEVTWEYAPDSDVTGDCNGDGKTDVKDLIRIKKYLAGCALVNNQADLTEADDEVNDKDVRVLRLLLLDQNVKQDAYVADGLPTYNESDEMTIGAYMGPRSAGKSSYTASYGDVKRYSKIYKDALTGVQSKIVTTDYLNDDEFARYAAAGFNMVLAEYDSAYVMGSDTGANEAYLEMAKKADVDVIMLPNSLAAYLRAEDGAKSESEVKQEIASMIHELSKYDNFAGIQMADEITAGAYERYSCISDFVKDTMGYDSLDLFTNFAYWDGTTLNGLMGNYGVSAGIYQYGYYALQKEWKKQGTFSTTYTKNNAFLQKEWFHYLSSAAESAKENGVSKLGLTVQSCGYEHPATTKDPIRRDITSGKISDSRSIRGLHTERKHLIISLIGSIILRATMNILQAPWFVIRMRVRISPNPSRPMCMNMSSQSIRS